LLAWRKTTVLNIKFPADNYLIIHTLWRTTTVHCWFFFRKIAIFGTPCWKYTLHDRSVYNSEVAG